MSTHTKALSGFRVAILVSDGFEQAEMTQPRRALEDAGAQTVLVSPARAEVQGWTHDAKGERFPVEIVLDVARPYEFDALLLPGGVQNADHLRMNAKAIKFVKHFASEDKPIAAICHGPWLLIEADVVRGRKVTSWPSLQTDLRNAGAVWVDEPAVADRGLITSRKPADLAAFNNAMIAEFASAGAVAAH